MDDGRVRRFLNSVMEEEELNDDEDDEDEVIEVDISALGTTSSPAHLITTQTISNQKNRNHANDSAKLTGLFFVNFCKESKTHLSEVESQTKMCTTFDIFWHSFSCPFT